MDGRKEERWEGYGWKEESEVVKVVNEDGDGKKCVVRMIMELIKRQFQG